jgi:MFS family permease
MFCPNCGHQNGEDVKFCIGCGKPLVVSTEGQTDMNPYPPPTPEPGRGGLILAFGILSIALLGPILGIPAWVMGHRDLKKIRAGVIAISQKGLTQAGMICGIVGTFISSFTIIILGIAIAVGLSMYSAQCVQSNKDAMINDLNNIAANAYQYKTCPSSMEGGSGTYIGYSIPSNKTTNANGSYSIVHNDKNNIVVLGMSSAYPGSSIQVKVDSAGTLVGWQYQGEFQ